MKRLLMILTMAWAAMARQEWQAEGYPADSEGARHQQHPLTCMDGEQRSQ